ncbi:MAG: HAD family hydrolase [Chloroflexi bacterium]|nr:HAD family hydrolase [Chloroflexota bacterium]
MNNLPYDAIIFDLDGTLRMSDPRFFDVIRDILREEGMDVPWEQWRPVEAWIHYYWARSPEIQEDVRTYGEEQLWHRFLYRLIEQVGYPATDALAERVARALEETYRPQSVLKPGVRELLEHLRTLPITLGILSNRRDPFDEEVDQLGIRDYFHFLLHSGALGVWKPDPRIFRAALEMAGDVPPERALYVGDNYYADVRGAHGVGMDALLIDDRGIFDVDDVPIIRDIREILDWLEEKRRQADGGETHHPLG